MAECFVNPSQFTPDTEIHHILLSCLQSWSPVWTKKNLTQSQQMLQCDFYNLKEPEALSEQIVTEADEG